MNAVAPARRRAPSSTSERPVRTPDIVRPRDLPYVVGLSATTVWRMRQRGEFPEPAPLSAGTVGWRRSDIDAWLESRFAMIKGEAVADGAGR